MYNFDDLISSIQMHIEQIQGDVQDAKELQSIYSEFVTLVERLGSSIDSYNSSYVSLSTFDNEGVETTSEARMKAAYSPIRSKLMIQLQQMQIRLNRLKSQYGMMIMSPALLSVGFTDEANSLDMNTLVKATLDGLTTVAYNNVRNFVSNPESNVPIYGVIPVTNVPQAGSPVNTAVGNFNAGGVANHSTDGALTLSPDSAAIASRFIVGWRDANAVTIDSFIYRVIFRQNGQIFLQLDGDNMKIYFFFSQSQMRDAAGILGSGIQGRAMALCTVINTLLSVTRTRMVTGQNIMDPIIIGTQTFTPSGWKNGLIYTYPVGQPGENNSFGYGSYIQSWTSDDRQTFHVWTFACGGLYNVLEGTSTKAVLMLEELMKRTHNILQTPAN